MYSILVLLLCVWVFGAVKASYRLGSGLAYNHAFTSYGITSDEWNEMPEARKSGILDAARARGARYAALMGVNSFLIGLLILLSVAFVLGEKGINRWSAVFIATGICFLESVSIANANMIIGQTEESAWYGAIGFSALTFVMFYILVGLLTLGKRALTSILGTETTTADLAADDPTTLMNMDIDEPSEAVTPPTMNGGIEGSAERPTSLMNLDLDTPGARVSRYRTRAHNWWRDQSEFFRRWAFISLVWATFIGLVVLLFEPFSFNVDDGVYTARTIFVMSIPPLAAGVTILYEKFVR